VSRWGWPGTSCSVASARALSSAPPEALFASGVVAAAHEADVLVANLDCCISARGSRWPDPDMPFFFRAPPSAVEALALLGVDCVTLANNHALDFGAEALLDTLGHLEAAGIAWVGAGVDVVHARAHVVLEWDGFRLGVIGLTDHPPEYVAAGDRSRVTYANLDAGLPEWLRAAVRDVEADAVLVTPHWGPNIAAGLRTRTRRAAGSLLEAGASLVAGHSAHVFHGVERRVIDDLGDFVDDYATHPALRNDLGLLFLVTFEHHRRHGQGRVEPAKMSAATPFGRAPHPTPPRRCASP